MALTKVSTDGVKDDAITSGKIPANQIEASELADNAVDTNAIADQAVALSKLPHGTSSNNGKFLRANNGADPTFETVNTDLVSDTSPQLGGTLDSNGNVISLGDAAGVNSNRIKLGAGNDLHIYHNGTNSTIREEGDGDLLLHTNNGSAIKLTSGSDENMVVANKDGAVELFQDNNRKFSTTSQGAAIGQVSTIPTMSDFSCQIQAGNSGFIGNYHSGSNQQFIIGLNQYYDGGYKAPDNNVSQQLQLYNKTFQFLTAPAAGSDNAAVTNTKILTIDDDGVKFGTDTAAANALDDYEEGTFSATGVNTSNSTFSSGLTGKYTKIGNRVFISIFFFAYGGSANQTVDHFGNLPFAGVSEPHATGVITRTSGGNNVNIEHEESCYLAQGGTQIRQKGTFSTGSSKNVTLSLTYMTTS